MSRLFLIINGWWFLKNNNKKFSVFCLFRG
jgi:hypothetical protein